MGTCSESSELMESRRWAEQSGGGHVQRTTEGWEAKESTGSTQAAEEGESSVATHLKHRK